MVRGDRRSAWGFLLDEPVTAYAKVRIVDDSKDFTVPSWRGTVILTQTRFIIIGNRLLSRFPRSSQDLQDLIKIQFPRTEITGVMLDEDHPSDITIRWMDRGEKKLRMRSKEAGFHLMNLVEGDLNR